MNHLPSPRRYRHCLLGLLALISAALMAAPAPDEPVSRGEYVSILGDCVACHTLPGGEPFAGGVRLPTPIGDIIATNITPSTTAGIGNYTLEQFDDAVRRGIRADGKRLYPAMPYTAYARVTDDDIAAMYEWFMNEVEPSDYQPPRTELPFPFNIRLSMAAWNLLFLDDEPFTPDPGQSEQWNRGAYLVEGLTHCGTCHTPRGLLMAEDTSRNLAGGAVGPWAAPDITSDPQTGIGDWSIEEIVQYMKTGNISKSQASGPMAEAIDHSLRYVTDEDLEAMAVYLKSVPAAERDDVATAVHRWGEQRHQLTRVRGAGWPEDHDDMNGAQLFDAYCAACHWPSAQGTPDGVMPALFNNTATGRPESNNLALVILEGIHWTGEGHEVHMPGFAHELSDRQITTLGNYLIDLYGNPDADVTVDQIQALREGSAVAQGQPDLLLLSRIAMLVGAVVVLLLVIWLLLRRRRRRDPLD